MCQQERWATKRCGLGSHVDLRREQVRERTLDPKGGGLGDPTSVEENKTFSIRVWKLLRSKRVLKP